MDLGSKKIKDKFKERYYFELALLLDSGLNLKASLELLASQEKTVMQKELIEGQLVELTRGARYSQVLSLNKGFTDYEVCSIEIGEETGNLQLVLNGLGRYFQKKIRQKRNFIGAITYPLVILFTSVLALSFMFLFMVPMFKDIFARMGNDLPWLTQKVILLSENFPNLLLGLMLLLTLLFFSYKYVFKKDAYRYQLGIALIKIPFFGKLILKNHLLRLVQSLNLLISSGVPVLDGLELTARMLSFYPMKQTLLQARESVMKGQSFYESFSQSALFNQRFVALLKVGEETNSLASLLTKMANQIDEELEHQSKVIGNLMEPLIIIFLGGLVALILISMYLPMFQLSSTF
jgi:type IV pilus assembly protein PilC